MVSPSSVTACGGATFPRQGGRLEHWHLLDCTVVSIDAEKSLPPHGGRWHGEAVTDEGEAQGHLCLTNVNEG